MVQQKEKPYRCWHSKCEFRCKTEKQLLNHYKKAHPEDTITEFENGSFEVKIGKVTTKAHISKKDKKAQKVKQSKPKKESKSKADKPKKESKPKTPKPDYKKLDSWSNVDEKLQAKILKDVAKQIEAGAIIFSQTRRYVAETHSVSVWPYTLQTRLDSEFAEARKTRAKELREAKKKEATV
ncbi:MAG: hypothetical protein ACTSWQ_05000 [Candidatus Thorarchaeota archaeon]